MEKHRVRNAFMLAAVGMFVGAVTSFAADAAAPAGCQVKASCATAKPAAGCTCPKDACACPAKTCAADNKSCATTGDAATKQAVKAQKAVFNAMDKNQDEEVDATEFVAFWTEKAAGGDKAAETKKGDFAKANKDGDDAVTVEEFVIFYVNIPEDKAEDILNDLDDDDDDAAPAVKK